MRWRGRQSMNSKWLGENFPATFDARRADLMGLKMRRITRGGSFDHLVGAAEHRGRQIQAERFGGLLIDDQIVLRRRRNRKAGRLLTLKNTVHIASRAPELVNRIRPIGEQAADSNVVAESIDCG